MIKAIIFDYFGVVSSDNYWQFVKEDKNVEGSFGRLAKAVNVGQMTWREFIAELSERTGTPAERINELYAAERINPELVAYISGLRRQFKTALLTNAHHDFVEPLFRQAHLDQIFDEVVVSSRVGALKPDARIFQYALNKLGVSPAEAIFIDDIERNVAGAEAVGMHGVLYEGLEKLIKSINHLVGAQPKH